MIEHKSIENMLHNSENPALKKSISGVWIRHGNVAFGPQIQRSQVPALYV